MYIAKNIDRCYPPKLTRYISQILDLCHTSSVTFIAMYIAKKSIDVTPQADTYDLFSRYI